MQQRNREFRVGMGVRDMLKAALYWYTIARETRNQELAARCKRIVRQHWRQRNTALIILNIPH